MRLINFEKMIPHKGVNYENAYTIYESDLEEATVEAISVEWIEDYYNGILSPYSDEIMLFKEMVRKWEEENG